jgi:hypothetical protein
MNENSTHVAAEIASLQRRADQLAASNVGTASLLANLMAEAAEARSADDATGAGRLDRRIHLIRQRDAQVVREIHTLEELIAARRTRYGLASPGQAGTGQT